MVPEKNSGLLFRLNIQRNRFKYNILFAPKPSDEGSALYFGPHAVLHRYKDNGNFLLLCGSSQMNFLSQNYQWIRCLILTSSA